jgi:glycosyltransferase involved in cell wall biosynthesis
MPSKSENFGHAIIEALSAGKPVITSHNTPWKNLQENKAGFNVSLNVEEIINAIDHFLKMSSEDYIEWSDAAVSFSKKAIDYKQLNVQYSNMFLDNKFIN